MLRTIARRLAIAPLVLLSVAVLVFLLVRLVPGDVVSRLVSGQGGNLSPEQRATIERLFGLDLPLHEQFGAWIGGVLQGDLGTSLVTDRPVLMDLGERFAVTAELALLALVITLGVGIPVGVIAAVHRGSWPDAVASGASLAGIAIPNFWLATLMVLFISVSFRLLPSAGYVPFLQDPVANLRLMILPVLALGLAEAAVVARVTRATVIGELHAEHVRTARSKGLPERIVLSRHVLRTSLAPIITVAGLAAGYLLSGTIIIEEIFSIPGIGRYALGGILDRDYPVVQGAVLLIAAVYLVVNLIVDVLIAVVDPRIREAV